MTARPLTAALGRGVRPRPALVLLRGLRTSTTSFAPETTPKASSSHGSFYGQFGTPVLKVFLGALFTYQALYWTWLKLEMFEEKLRKDEEVGALEARLLELRPKKP